MTKADARFVEQMAKSDARFEEQNAKIHRMLTLFEEQESRNKYVLDGYTSLNDRLEKVEDLVRSVD